MQQFTVVLHELRKWFESIKAYQLLKGYELHLMFGGVGLLMLRSLLFQMVSTVKGYETLHTLFYTIPLSSLAYLAFLIGVWMTLVSPNIKYAPYALWGYAFYILYPFKSISLSSAITPAVYVFLGVILYKYVVTISKPTQANSEI
ncbi:MAG: hypothetical protein P0Y55_01165 [Candidatus Cohnella colombiensis]|uniref:Uncharacterized protein n=1 Tax=Candidatus Cohnella colombiensis TaxID=3121368 RepID=A0AA95EWH7_9BACL|nr:MAG: hypothetical protein P0Y55_01165 [Cohnella sp.]